MLLAILLSLYCFEKILDTTDFMQPLVVSDFGVDKTWIVTQSNVKIGTKQNKKAFYWMNNIHASISSEKLKLKANLEIQFKVNL